MLNNKLYYFFVLFLLFPLNSYAGAWTNKPGEATLINTIYYWHFNEFTTSEGEIQSRPDFYKVEYKPYFEYGLTDSLSAGVSPSFQHVVGEYNNSVESGLDTNDALVSSDIFVKTKLYEDTEEQFVFTIIPLIELPGVYKEESTPFFGKQESFWNVILAFGKNIYNIENNYGYINFEAGFRSRFSESFSSESGDSVKLSLVTGIPVKPSDSIIFSVDYTKTVSGYGNTTSFLDRYGYDSLQTTVGGKSDFSDFSLEYGYTIQQYSRNSGIGDGFRFSVLHKF